jgi:hypothetical protein
MVVSTFDGGSYCVGWLCQQCGQRGERASPRWFCQPCGDDVCLACVARAAAGRATLHGFVAGGRGTTWSECERGVAQVYRSVAARFLSADGGDEACWRDADGTTARLGSFLASARLPIGRRVI